MSKKIGLALSGGGARGFAHIGVLKVLVENNIPIDIIAGTSAGSIIGGAFASGMTVEEIFTMASKVRWTNMTRPSLSPLGILSNSPLGKFIGQYFPVSRFENLTIPFGAVVCNLGSGEEIIIKDTGDLASAIRTSCAVPGLFAPIKDEKGRLLVDGGVVSPVPTDAVRRMGADIVIAVDLIACGITFLSLPRTAVGMIFQSAMASLCVASRNQHHHADIVIEPQIAHLRMDEIKKRDEFIQLGEDAALKMIDEIHNLIRDRHDIS